MSKVSETVMKVIAEELGVNLGDVTDSANIISDLDADSLDVVELMNTLEEQFDIEISDDDAQKLVTVAEIIAYVERKAQAVR